MLSAVAGVLDAGGGFRVVITQAELMHHHVGPGERLFVVPGLMVQEPVDAIQAGDLVARVGRYIAENR